MMTAIVVLFLQMCIMANSHGTNHPKILGNKLVPQITQRRCLRAQVCGYAHMQLIC